MANLSTLTACDVPRLMTLSSTEVKAESILEENCRLVVIITGLSQTTGALLVSEIAPTLHAALFCLPIYSVIRSIHPRLEFFQHETDRLGPTVSGGYATNC